MLLEVPLSIGGYVSEAVMHTARPTAIIYLLLFGFTKLQWKVSDADVCE